MNSDPDKKSFLPFRKDECILNSKNVTFEDRIVALMNIWEIIASMNVVECTVYELVEILEWAKLHSLNITLEAEWGHYAMQNSILLERNIERSKNQLANVNHGFIVPCEKLIATMKNPWQDSVLLDILRNTEVSTQDEIINFFRMETAYLTGVRLMKLCEARCEDMATNLATAFIDSFYLSCGTDDMIPATYSQVWFIYDLFISLLFKYNNRQKVLEMLNSLTTEEGYSLVKRLVMKNKKLKIWSLAPKLAILVSQIYITRIALAFSQDMEDMFKELVENYYILNRNSCTIFEFISTIKRISDLTNRLGLHKICYVLNNINDKSLNHLLIEMYIKSITTDINECENYKNNGDIYQLEFMTEELAETFGKLSRIFDDNVEVARECALTAFSLKPTTERLKILEYFAARSGISVEPHPTWKCRLHPPVLQSDDIAWLCSECGDWMTKPQLTRPTENNITLHQILRTEVLGIPQILCDDLSVCISYQRYQILSWYQPWHELHRLCFMYLRDPAGTKNFITELKYVDLDYSVFKHIKREPQEFFAGIEKGYENCLEFYSELVLHKNEVSSSSEGCTSTISTLKDGIAATSTSTLKDFIIKLSPLHVTADLFSTPKVVLECNKVSQHIIDQKLRKPTAK